MIREEVLENFEYTLTGRALRQIKAEAWEEGKQAGMDIETYNASPINPYLSARPSSECAEE